MKRLRQMLIEAIASASGFDELKQSLRALLGAAADDEEDEIDFRIGEKPVIRDGGTPVKRRRVSETAKASKYASSSSLKKKTAPATKIVNNGTNDNMKNTNPAENVVNGTDADMTDAARTNETTVNVDNGTNVDMEDDSTFHTVQNPRNAAKAAKKANTAAARPARLTPLVLEGVREEDRS